MTQRRLYATLPLSHGHATIEWNDDIKADEAHILLEWIDLLKRKMCRSVYRPLRGPDPRLKNTPLRPDAAQRAGEAVQEGGSQDHG